MSDIENNARNNPEISPAQVDAVLKQAEQAVAEAKAAPAEPAATPEGITLTLGAKEPTPPEVAKVIAESAKAVPDADEVRDKFTPEEEAMIREFSKKIDVTDANLVFSYGANAQQQIASFSDSALKNVKTKDLGEVGDMIAGLVTELKGFTIDEKEGGFFAFFKRNVDKLTMLKNAMTRRRSTWARSSRASRRIRCSCSRISPRWISFTRRTFATSRSCPCTSPRASCG
jgi:uncharacterized protein YaaN involved in tellurite resistance